MSGIGWHPAWSYKEVEIQSCEPAHQGFYVLNNLVLRYKCFSGEWSAWLAREQVVHKHAAVVLLIDCAKKALVMVEQCRVGLLSPFSQEKSPWMLEWVAGAVEPKEDPMQTAIREAKEEAQCEIETCHTIASYYNSPGGVTEKTTLFWATTHAPPTGSLGGLVSEHEDIRIHVLPIEQVLSDFAAGSFVCSASTVIGLQWLQTHQQEMLSLSSG